MCLLKADQTQIEREREHFVVLSLHAIKSEFIKKKKGLMLSNTGCTGKIKIVKNWIGEVKA